MKKKRALLFVISTAICWSAWAATPPANDNFASAELITVLPASVTGSNIGATREADEPYHADNPGGASVWWKITPPESGYLTLSTSKSTSILDGPALDTVLAVYAGSVLSNLVLIGANDDDENGSWTSKLLVSVTGGVQYQIAVDGYKDDTFGPDQGRIVLGVSFGKTISYQAAPAWQLPNLQGNLVESSDFTNQVLLLNFWATWCPPCIAEIPDLITLQEKYRNLGLVVVGISIDDAVNNKLPAALVGTFARNHAMNYPIVMTRPGGSTVETDYGPLNAIPTTVIIDRKNNIVRRTVGAHQLSEFQSYVLPYLLDSITLRARRADGVTTLEWPTVPAQVRVQYSDQFPATSWNLVPGTLVEGAETTTFSVDADPSGQTRFYRLEIVP